MIHVLYNYYYLYCKKNKGDTFPHVTAILLLAAVLLSPTLLIAGICHKFFDSFYLIICIQILLLGILLYYFLGNGRYRKIIEAQPMFFNNHKLTKILVVFISLFLFFLGIFGAIYIKEYFL
ncbi:MAG: hypothetical protein LBI82_02160 [Dysgonamonadaceae bacterium]|jgi:heme/copper-type cytochrome/quinol oxidase subunit 2|nr:hypothetical protein [Dysgonamonadaceae bacterium]